MTAHEEEFRKQLALIWLGPEPRYPHLQQAYRHISMLMAWATVSITDDRLQQSAIGACRALWLTLENDADAVDIDARQRASDLVRSAQSADHGVSAEELADAKRISQQQQMMDDALHNPFNPQAQAIASAAIEQAARRNAEQDTLRPVEGYEGGAAQDGFMETWRRGLGDG